MWFLVWGVGGGDGVSVEGGVVDGCGASRGGGEILLGFVNVETT